MRHWYWYTGTDSGTKTSTLVLDKSDKLRCGPDTITLVLVLITLLHYAVLTLDQVLDNMEKLQDDTALHCTGSPSLGHNSLKMCAMRNAHIALYWNLLHWGDVPMCLVVW